MPTLLLQRWFLSGTASLDIMPTCRTDVHKIMVQRLETRALEFESHFTPFQFVLELLPF